MDSSSTPFRRADRRHFLRTAALGSVVSVLGGAYYLADDAEATGERRPDGRPRLPPGQRLLRELKPMGGQAGSPLRKDFQVSVSGAVERPFRLNFEELMAMGVEERAVDVHCVTGWTVLGARFKGVRFQKLAERAGVRSAARYVVLEAAHGYTANLPLREALASDSMLAHELNGSPLRRAHGAPVRGLVPDLYFWKSPKWLTGLRFVERDEPGYWERRGYHNHGDPWREERYG
jgi:DMSO/TMAO reductase YedYZ molybdopterin-dependent catalytic subunit